MLDNRLGNSLGNTLCNNVGPDNHNIAEKLHLSCALLRSVKSSWIKMGQTQEFFDIFLYFFMQWF